MRTIINTRKMENSDKVESERKYLVDFVNSLASKYGSGVIENLSYVDKVLHEDDKIAPEMLGHAKALRCLDSTYRENNSETIIAKLEESELPIVKNYLHALEGYLMGKSYFQTIFPAAVKFLKPTPVPDSAKFPDTEFYRELRLVRQLV